MSSKFKPGQMVMLKGCSVPSNNGKIVTLVKFYGKLDFSYRPGEWWEIDTPIKFIAGDIYVGMFPHAPEDNMIPLSDPDLSNDIAEEKEFTHNQTGDTMNSEEKKYEYEER